MTGQDLATILGTWPYPLKGIFLMILSLRALPWVRESWPLTGKFQGMQLGSLAVGDNVTDSRLTVPGATPLAGYSWYLVLAFCAWLALSSAWRRGYSVSGYVCNHGSLRVGNETLHPLGTVPCFGRKLQMKKWMTYFPGAPLYCGRAGQQVVFLYVCFRHGSR